MLNLIGKLERGIRFYLGINDDKLYAHKVVCKDGKLFVTGSLPFKRHQITLSLDKFYNINQTHLNDRETNQLGHALGKSIASNFSISFKK